MALIASVAVSGQNQPPVAINDTVSYPVHIGDFITINVLENDYDPEGDSVYIINAPFAYSVTDSTITYFIDPAGIGYYDNYWLLNGYVKQTYTIWDSISFTTGSANVVFYLDEPFYDYLDINNIKARFNSFGNHFWDFGYGAGAQYYYPKDSLTSTIFGSSLWIGGMDETGDLRVSAERYRQIGDDFWEGPLTTDGTASTDTANAMKWHKIWKLNLEDIEYHLDHWSDPGYEPIENIATWPAHGDTTEGQSYYLAPFVDVNNNGDYEPLSGDYPLIRGDQTLFFIFNDQTDTAKRETKGMPIGIEIHGFAYAFDTPDNPALYNTTFLSYKIFNRSQHTLTDTYAGIWTDIDVGFAWDDYIGCDVAGGYYYGYNGDDYDDPTWNNIDSTYFPGYEYNIPAQGVVVLGGPYLDPDGEDNPAGECDESINGVGFGDGIADNERYGMNRFLYFDNSAGVTGSPVIYYQYYNFMKTIWKDSTAMEYGGNGHVSSGAYGPAANFMFPGLSDPCNWGTGGIPPYGALDWTDESAGNPPSDRRGVSSMGPFTLEPGEVVKIDFAFVTAPGDSTSDPVEKLKVYVDSVKAYYYEDPDHFGFKYLDNEEVRIERPEIVVYPVPASEVLYLKFVNGRQNATCYIYDIFGRKVKTVSLSEVNGINSIDISGLKQGTYILHLNTGKAVIAKKFLVK